MMSPKRNKILKLIPFLLFSFLLVGCFHAEEPTQKKESDQNQKQRVIKKPPETTITEQILNQQQGQLTQNEQICESRGYQVVQRFDQKKERTQHFCQFDDGTECLLQEFATGVCGPGKGAKRFKPKKETKVRANCKDLNPVCGENGHTYQNECLAEQAGVKIDHKGKCKPQEIEKIQEETEPTQSEDQSQTTPDDEITQDQQTEWLDLAISLVKGQTKTNPAAVIKKCDFVENTVYYQGNNTNQVISTLYNEKGEFICHPNKDISSECPDYFQKDSNQCKIIWKDGR